MPPSPLPCIELLVISVPFVMLFLYVLMCGAQ